MLKFFLRIWIRDPVPFLTLDPGSRINIRDPQQWHLQVRDFFPYLSVNLVNSYQLTY
jgi:hypothetical protein